MTRMIEAHVDATEPLLAGWLGFSPGSDTPDAGKITVSLMMGDTRIGSVARRTPRPDVDAFLGYVGVPKGFAVPLAAIAGHARLAGTTAPRLLVEGTDAEPLVLDLAAHMLPAPPLALAGGIDGWVLRDAWFATGRRLMLRCESDGTAPDRQVAAFQAHGPGRALVRLTHIGTLAGRLGLIGLDLLDPYQPVLLVLTNGDDAIVASDWIPFPTLARDGVHAAETLALSDGGDLQAGLVALSARLTDAALERRATEFANRMGCARLRYDAVGCSGGEVMFDGGLVDLIAGHGIAIEIVESDAAPISAIGQALTARVPPPATGPAGSGTTLILSGNAVPTLSALLGPHLLDTRPGGGAPGYVAVLAGGDPQAWLVTPPAAVATKTGPQLLPPDGTGGSVALPVPAAILLAPAPTRFAASAVYPVAVDAPVTAPAPSPITAIVSAPAGHGLPLALLQSIAAQEGFAEGEVLLSMIHGQPFEPAAAALEALFPGRHRIIVHAVRHAPIREHRLMMGYAAHQTLMLLDPETVLHDPRTFTVLAGMLADDAVGLAGCTLVHGDGGDARFASAGYCLAGIDLRGGPSLRFDMPDPRRIVAGPITVAAVPFGAIGVRRDRLIGLPDPAAPSQLAAVDELRLGLDMLRQGWCNRVTVDVSATTHRTDLRGQGLAAALPLALGTGLLDRLARQATGLQRL